MKQQKHQISASILSADFARLGEDVAAVLAAGVARLHIDVMDNHYVPNLTFGPMVVKALRAYGIKAPMDVHLMVTPVDDLIVQFAQAGVDYILFHPEATQHVDRSLQLIKDHGCKAGLALNIATPLSVLEHVMTKLDRVLLMSVNPGFGGQKLISAVYPKIKMLRRQIGDSQLPIEIEVDGGVTVDNIATLAAAGVDVFVTGSALFGASDYTKVRQTMHDELASSV